MRITQKRIRLPEQEVDSMVGTLMSETSLARTPEPPYYAVIFTSQRTEGDRGYGNMAQRMAELAKDMPGFLGLESVRGEDGFGISVSYWASEEAIKNWKAHTEHQVAQATGKKTWYENYALRVAKVERAYGK
jgi:heme-degrading monooxygenase HmoA